MSSERVPSSAKTLRSGAYTPVASSVEPPPESATMMRSPAKSCATPKNVRRASTSPGITCGLSPNSRRPSSSSAALDASRAALVHVVQTHTAPKARASSTNMRHAASTRSTAASQKRPVASTPSPKSVISVCLDDSTIAPPSTCASTSRDDTVPKSIAATLYRLQFVIAGSPPGATRLLAAGRDRLTLDAVKSKQHVERLNVPRRVLADFLNLLGHFAGLLGV